VAKNSIVSQEKKRAEGHRKESSERFFVNNPRKDREVRNRRGRAGENVGKAKKRA